MPETPSPNDPKMPNWGLPALSWLVSFYFLSGFVHDLGFPPKANISYSHVIMLLIWLFFVFIPFFNKIKIGKFLELERDVEKAKTDLKEFKEEVRSNLAIVSTNINSISNISSQLTVNLPGQSDLEAFKKLLDEKFPETKLSRSKQIQEDLMLDEDDTIMALARTRIKIESLLRKIVQTISTPALFPEEIESKISLRSMFRIFTQRYDQYLYLREPFDYVIRACNAAVHAQRISSEQSEEAINLGAKIITILSYIANGVDDSTPSAT